jgi:hypothetical protein
MATGRSRDRQLARRLRFGSADSANLARQILVARLHAALRQSTPTATDTSSELQLLEVLQSAKKNVNAVPACGDTMGFDTSASQLR